MSMVKLKYVVSFTSQDKKHKIENLVRQDGSGRWLCAPEDRTGRLEAVLQLERACHISHIDIGSFRALCLTVQVGRSSWEMGKEFKDLVVGTTMMSPAEARTGAGKNGLKMFKYDTFCADARDEAWDRLKIILTQPFRRDIQFGLSLLRIMSSDGTEENPGSASKGLVTNPTTSKSVTPARMVNNKSAYSSPSWRSTEEIKKHFFKKDQESNKREEEVKSTLVKIGATAENGSSQGVLASRITKMVMAAAGKSPVYKPQPFPSPASSSASSSSAQQSCTPKPSNTPRRGPKKLTFEEEVSKFLGGLEVENLDLNKMSFADLRHQLEKIKCRKLSKEEKKEFFVKAKEFIEKITSKQNSSNQVNNSSNQGNKRKSSSDLQDSVPKKRQIDKQIEKEDRSLAERLNSSANERSLAALKSPQSINREYKNTSDSKTPNPGTAKRNDAKTPASPFHRKLIQTSASPPLKKGKAPLVMGKSFNVEVAPTSKRAAFEALLEREDTVTPVINGVVYYNSPKLKEQTKAQTPKSVKKEPAISKAKKTPARSPMSQPAPANVWLSKAKGTEIFCNSQPHASRAAEMPGKTPTSAKAKKKRKSVPGEEMVSCPICKGEFPASKIQLHSAACGIMSSDEEDDGVMGVSGASEKIASQRDSPGGFLKSPSYGFYLPSESENTPDMVECPLCFDKFPNWRIEHHTNKCLAASKS